MINFIKNILDINYFIELNYKNNAYKYKKKIFICYYHHYYI